MLHHYLGLLHTHYCLLLQHHFYISLCHYCIIYYVIITWLFQMAETDNNHYPLLHVTNLATCRWTAWTLCDSAGWPGHCCPFPSGPTLLAWQDRPRVTSRVALHTNRQDGRPCPARRIRVTTSLTEVRWLGRPAAGRAKSWRTSGGGPAGQPCRYPLWRGGGAAGDDWLPSVPLTL